MPLTDLITEIAPYTYALISESPSEVSTMVISGFSGFQPIFLEGYFPYTMYFNITLFLSVYSVAVKVFFQDVMVLR